MLIGDPVVIKTTAMLQTVGTQMKISAVPDDGLETYTKTSADAAALLRGESLSKATITEIRHSGAVRVIILEGHPISLVMTTDDHHGKDWHLSMSELAGPTTLKTVGKQLRERILNAFFSQWKQVNNPGELRLVLHFIGSD